MCATIAACVIHVHIIWEELVNSYFNLEKANKTCGQSYVMIVCYKSEVAHQYCGYQYLMYIHVDT